MKINRYVIPLLAISLWCAPLASFSKDMSWVRTLRQILPPFKIERIHPDGPLNYPSPNGDWFAYPKNNTTKMTGKSNPASLILYDRNGKFVRNLTVNKFTLCEEFIWSQTGNALFVWIDPGYESSPQKGGVWKIDIKKNAYTHYGVIIPVAQPDPDSVAWRMDPFSSRELPLLHAFNLPVCSPDGNSYLIFHRPKDSNLAYIYRVWFNSRKWRKLAYGCHPVWSPDGKWISYQLWSKTTPFQMNDVWIIKNDGKNKRCIFGNSSIKLLNKWRITDYSWVGFKHPMIIIYLYRKTFNPLKDKNWGMLLLYDVKGRLLKKVPFGSPSQDVGLVSVSGDGEHLYFSFRNVNTKITPYGRDSKYRYYRVTLEGGR